MYILIQGREGELIPQVRQPLRLATPNTGCPLGYIHPRIHIDWIERIYSGAAVFEPRHMLDYCKGEVLMQYFAHADLRWELVGFLGRKWGWMDGVLRLVRQAPREAARPGCA
jgi:hypothetical protein